eukprot:TRINITY_DN21020_c0_g1_i2.p1 TRINITY_DN21020_c0_g1~~TRINITY_DN21020_c0_g1_i2.p1  ORF type:complete len:162 (-),score=11.21 TRINITY_DN21020_c0_g1_i2:400-885(-)
MDSQPPDHVFKETPCGRFIRALQDFSSKLTSRGDTETQATSLPAPDENPSESKPVDFFGMVRFDIRKCSLTPMEYSDDDEETPLSDEDERGPQAILKGMQKLAFDWGEECKEALTNKVSAFTQKLPPRRCDLMGSFYRLWGEPEEVFYIPDALSSPSVHSH